jgi:hypothetical protein
MFTHFKNDSIRKLVIAFGSLFNNIKLEQKDENNNQRLFSVPLSYAAKEKFVKRLTEPSSISDKTRVEISLPRMSFELVGMIFDHTRKLNKLNKKICTDGTNSYSLYSEVPYNFTFNLNVFTRNLEENLQIMEQILPYFSPEFVVSIKMNSLNQSVDVPISIASTTLTQEYEGDFSTRRFIVSSYQFIVKSYVYGPIKGEYPIKDIEMQFLQYGQLGMTLSNIFGITG